MIATRVNKKCILSFFVDITAHLLPLTNYLINGQYAKVQPIASKFAERKYLHYSLNKLACPGNAHLRTVNCGFSNFGCLKLALVIQLHNIEKASLALSSPSKSSNT